MSFFCFLCKLYYLCIVKNKDKDMNKKEFLDLVTKLSELTKDSEFYGHVYVAGGAVRDYVMNCSVIKDIDIAVELVNGGIRYAEYMSKKLGTSFYQFPAYGTAMFLIDDCFQIECVQTRKEQYREDSRNPECVFGSLKEDCYRRDITINSLYMDINTKEVIDLTGHGIEDINDGIIRTTSDADIIFNDDPLRILRAIRFASKYMFKMDDNTLNGIKKNAYRLSIITQERITDEFTKMFSHKYPNKTIEYLKETEVTKYFLPELNLDTLKILFFGSQDFITRLTLIMWNCSHDENIVEEILRRMKFPVDIIKSVLFYYKNYNLFFGIYSEPRIIIRRAMYFCKTEYQLNSLVDFIIDCNHSSYDEKDLFFLSLYFEDTLEEMKKHNDETYDLKLPVNGNDIKNHFGVNGKTVGYLLNESYKYCFKNPKITKEELLNTLEDDKFQND